MIHNNVVTLKNFNMLKRCPDFELLSTDYIPCSLQRCCFGSIRSRGLQKFGVISCATSVSLSLSLSG